MQHAAAPTATTATFPTDTTNLDPATDAVLVDLDDGATFDLSIHPVVKDLGPARARMLSYNGSIPGPTLRVRQGSEVTIRVVNHGDTEATVHWHGLRLANEYDGVPHDTQPPIPIGSEFTYRLRFPDPGVFWYHPHVREDHGIELGLYGNILVVPVDPDYWPPVNQEAVVTLDDVLVENGQIAPFSVAGPTHVAMGRFGNVMLTAGQTDLALSAQVGGVVRFYFTNTANTRLFNVSLPGARMKLVGGDSGRRERDAFVDEVLLSPSERAIVDVLFGGPGHIPLVSRNPDRSYRLGVVTVRPDPPRISFAAEFDTCRIHDEFADARRRFDAELDRAPDKTLLLTSLMPLLYGTPRDAAGSYTCPMHPHVIDAESGACPHCGMRLVPAAVAYVCPMHPEITSTEPSTCPQCGMRLVPASVDHVDPPGHLHPDSPGHQVGQGHAHDHEDADGLEWEDLMSEINAASNADNMLWKIVDADTGHENAEIDWTFRVGDRVKIRLVNGMDQDHPMHHPFHIHGAGRFLVLARNDQPQADLLWKDTVLVRAGETVDILLEVTTPGLWMAHCHIAEHNQSGMMFSFTAEPGCA